MLGWFSVIFALAGFYLATLKVINDAVGKPLRLYAGTQKNGVFYASLFLCFLAWALSCGVMSMVPVWGFTSSLPWAYCQAVNGVLGLVALIWAWPVLADFGQFRKRLTVRLSRAEKFVLLFIALVLAMYFYRVTIPWSDRDEIVAYGYFSKLMSSGRTLQDMLHEKGPQCYGSSFMVQSWDAMLYGLVNDTWLVRFARLLNFVFCGFGVFSFLRLVGARRFWSLTAVAGFLSIPELSYLAVSTKVDAVVMMFELAALLAVAMAFVIYWKDTESQGSLRAAAYLSVFALAGAAFAFGNRFSGIIVMVLCAGCGWFFLNKFLRRPWAAFAVVFALFCFLMFISASGCWANIVIYGNPIYPTKPFWPFQNGTYVSTFTMEWFRANWNIVGFPPVVLQVYLVFALGVGLELLAKALPFLNCLPMAAMRTTSMGWPFPFILGVFFWPFFRGSNKALDLIAGLFIFQLVSWSLGLHYSRVFLASSTLMILAMALMADMEVPSSDRVRSGIQKLVRVWVIISLMLSLLFQVWWFEKRYWGLFLITSEQRYHAAAEFVKNREDNREQNLPTFQEVRTLNRFFLDRDARPLVYVVTYSGVLHAIFDGRIHIKNFDSSDPWCGEGKYILINPGMLRENGPSLRVALMRYFPVHVLTTPDTGWELYSVVGASR